ncbi:MAG: sn-glycerol-1-phosphate dehydrogenase [Thermoprotei archaeon]
MVGINRIEMARYVYMGPGVIKELPNIIELLELKSKSVLIFSGGKKTTSIALDMVKPLIESSNIIVNSMNNKDLFDFIENLSEILKNIKNLKTSLLIGVGGGRVMDITKVISYYLKIPYISVPTSASHDGTASPAIATPFANLLRSKYGQLESIRAPHAIVADIEIISKAPRETITSGVGDLVAKLTAVRDWRLAHLIKGEEFSEYAASLALMSAHLVSNRAKIISTGNLEGVSVLVKALIGSGVAISIAGNSRPASGSEHLFSHALDYLAAKYGFKPNMHGVQCGIGTIMMAKLHGLNWRKIKKILRTVNAPVNSEELGINPEYIVKALSIAHTIKSNFYTVLGENGITENAARKLAMETGIIPYR